MKKTMMIVMGGMLTLAAYAQDSTHQKGNPAMPTHQGYCVALRDGKNLVLTNGVMLNADVTLNNGTLLRPNGTILKKDGTKEILKEGQCIDMNGNITWKKDGK